MAEAIFFPTFENHSFTLAQCSRPFQLGQYYQQDQWVPKKRGWMEECYVDRAECNGIIYLRANLARAIRLCGTRVMLW